MNSGQQHFPQLFSSGFPRGESHAGLFSESGEAAAATAERPVS